MSSWPLAVTLITATVSYPEEVFFTPTTLDAYHLIALFMTLPTSVVTGYPPLNVNLTAYSASGITSAVSKLL